MFSLTSDFWRRPRLSEMLPRSMFVQSRYIGCQYHMCFELLSYLEGGKFLAFCNFLNFRTMEASVTSIISTERRLLTSF